MNRDIISDGLPSSLLGPIRHVALDMDGTIYNGGTLFPFTLPFLALLDQLSIGFTFLTNNSSRSSADYIAKLGVWGIRIGPQQIYTSTQATIGFLRTSLPGVNRLFVLGTPSMQEELCGAGFELTPNPTTEEPEAVIVGFDTDLSYPRLCKAAYWISKGKPFIATHPDRICPTDQPTVLVDCGAVCAALESATGRRPDKVLGKPDPCMLDGILQRHGLRPNQLAMVGDRLYTDVAMAHRAGALGVLVLTGEAKAHEVAGFQPAPGLVVESLKEFGEQLSITQSATLPGNGPPDPGTERS